MEQLNDFTSDLRILFLNINMNTEAINPVIYPVGLSWGSAGQYCSERSWHVDGLLSSPYRPSKYQPLMLGEVHPQEVQFRWVSEFFGAPKSGMLLQSLMSAVSQIWVSKPTPVVQLFRHHVQPAAGNRDTREEKLGAKGGSILAKNRDRLTSNQGLCSVKKLPPSPGTGLPKPQQEFWFSGSVLLALCKQGCSSLAAGICAVSFTRCKSMKF